MSISSSNDGPTYAKIIGDNFGSYPYRVGLNTLAHNGETFNATPECGPGGLYFCEIKNILEFLGYGNQLCIIEPVGQVVAVGNKFKTDKLEIVSMMSLKKTETWEFLIDHGLGYHADESLQWAAQEGLLNVVKFLVEHCTNTHMRKGNAMCKAAANGHLEVVKFLVGHCTNTHMRKGNAMCKAAEYGRLEIVKFLVEHGADVPSKKNYALLLAAENGHLEVVKFLVDRGADVGLGHAMQFAAENGHLEVVKFLVDHGADVSAGNFLASRDAAENGHLEVVKFLVEHNRDIFANSDAMLWIAERCSVETVEYIFSL